MRDRTTISGHHKDIMQMFTQPVHDTIENTDADVTTQRFKKIESYASQKIN